MADGPPDWTHQELDQWFEQAFDGSEHAFREFWGTVRKRDHEYELDPGVQLTDWVPLHDAWFAADRALVDPYLGSFFELRWEALSKETQRLFRHGVEASATGIRQRAGDDLPPGLDALLPEPPPAAPPSEPDPPTTPSTQTPSVVDELGGQPGVVAWLADPLKPALVLGAILLAAGLIVLNPFGGDDDTVVGDILADDEREAGVTASTTADTPTTTAAPTTTATPTTTTSAPPQPSTDPVALATATTVITRTTSDGAVWVLVDFQDPWLPPAPATAVAHQLDVSVWVGEGGDRFHQTAWSLTAGETRGQATLWVDNQPRGAVLPDFWTTPAGSLAVRVIDAGTSEPLPSSALGPDASVRVGSAYTTALGDQAVQLSLEWDGTVEEISQAYPEPEWTELTTDVGPVVLNVPADD